MAEGFMRRALELAAKGEGKVNPNPLVGAVIVKDNRIIGEGYHEYYGGNHAEINAIKNSKESLEGATIYVTLEPCHHYGKTPPCVDEIIKRKFSKVVIGQVDPNPLVAGKSVEKLKTHGIEVRVGVLEEECKKLNEVFNKYILINKPYVVLKAAMSLDGKIATASGESMWITGEISRENVHKLRNKYSAIMVGVNTVIKDNPSLTCRLVNGRNPVRVIVDSSLRIPLESKVLDINNNSRCIIATSQKASREKITELKDKGIEILILPLKDEKVDIKELIEALGKLKIDSILLEGGGTLNFSFLEEGLVDKVQFYIAPKLIGGKDAKTPIEGIGIKRLSEHFEIDDMQINKLGEDLLIEGYLRR